MSQDSHVTPFTNCPALDGYHCVTSAMRKIYAHAGHPLSEDMLLGIGAGMGFIYWKMKLGASDAVFIGGRARDTTFYQDIGRRTGVEIRVFSTASAKRAEAALLEKLCRQEPVMVFGDMGYLPWFEFPAEYHFGGHSFVVCGYDGKEGVLVSDMDQKASGLKKGFYAPVTLQQLGKARGSTYKPFPAQNTWLEFDFRNFHLPQPQDLYAAIGQTVESHLHPPIKNIGIKGMRHAAREILKWPQMFPDYDLRMNLFSLYIYIEIGGTGGGCFRSMYSRFLKEAAALTRNDRLLPCAEAIQQAGETFSEIGRMFQDAETAPDLNERIARASGLFLTAAGLEEATYNELNKIVETEGIHENA